MSDNELLLAISEMMDQKLKAGLKPMENRLDRMEDKMQIMQDDMKMMQDDMKMMQDDMKMVQSEMQGIKLFQENVILPRLNTIESCYTDTYNRYKDYVDKMDAVCTDNELLKKVVTEHSEKLQKLA